MEPASVPNIPPPTYDEAINGSVDPAIIADADDENKKKRKQEEMAAIVQQPTLTAPSATTTATTDPLNPLYMLPVTSSNSDFDLCDCLFSWLLCMQCCQENPHCCSCSDCDKCCTDCSDGCDICCADCDCGDCDCNFD